MKNIQTYIIIGSIESVTIHLIINGVKLRDCFGGSGILLTTIYGGRWLYGYDELFYTKRTKANTNQTEPKQIQRATTAITKAPTIGNIPKALYPIITLKTVWNAQFEIDLWWDRKCSTNNAKKLTFILLVNQINCFTFATNNWRFN